MLIASGCCDDLPFDKPEVCVTLVRLKKENEQTIARVTIDEVIHDYISANRDHLEADNVLGPIYKAFGDRLWPLMKELNLTLAA